MPIHPATRFLWNDVGIGLEEASHQQRKTMYSAALLSGSLGCPVL